MSTISETIEKQHQLIIVVLLLIIVFFLVACTFHDVIPICHYVFGR
jgi:TRAP-type C4-dicarboxylate transport system permease large subunit